MKTFQEFLKEQATYVRAEEAVREARKHEWVAAVRTLMAELKTWLMESDTERILRVEERIFERFDESIGPYEIMALSIWLGKRGVGVEPVAFDVLGPMLVPTGGTWKGRVDLIGEDHVNVKLYRCVKSNEADSWWIVDRDDRQVRLFTRDGFESALLSLLS